MRLKCPKCNSELRRVEVDIEDAKTPAVSYQCENVTIIVLNIKRAYNQTVLDSRPDLCTISPFSL